jgi:hypothetical protein
MSPSADLAENLAWLDYCLGETQEAMAVVKAVIKDPRAKSDPGVKEFHDLIAMASLLAGFRWRLARWAAGWPGNG